MGAEFTHVLDSLGWAVLHSIWQGGVALLAVIVWRLALRGQSPALRHAGQVAVLIACLAAFIWTFAVYLGVPNSGVVGGATLSTSAADPAPRLLTGLIAPFDPSAQAAANLSRITPLLACLWAVGFAAMSLRYAFAFGQVQQLRTLGIQNPSPQWTNRFKRLAQQSGVSAQVRLYISANVAGPMTLGLIKPVVLVPVGFLTGLPGDQIEAILRHELAHIRRYDYAMNLVQTGVKTVLFFHPAIHIICRWADQDREQACDDLAVREGHNPLTLARGLAALRLQAQPTLGLAATGNGKDMPLLDRLTRLAGQAPKRGRSEHILMSVMSALLLGAVYLGSTTRAEAHPVPPAIPDTVISIESVPPVPPVPPVLPSLDFSKLNDQGDLQSFIETDKAIYKSYKIPMDQYENRLRDYVENNNLSEDELEDMVDAYEDFADEIEDLFEDRREEIEDLYEEKFEREMEAQEEKWEREAEILGLASALKGLEAAEREMMSQSNSKMKDIQLKAIKQARKDVARAQANASMAQSQAETARSVARANALRDAKSAHKSTSRKKSVHTEIDRESQTHHEEFRDKVMYELLKDGLIKSSKDTVVLSHPKNVMSLNGKPVGKGLRGKYCALWDDYGFIDNYSEVTIKPDSLTILTDWKNGQHTTRVTYGTFETEKTSH